VRYDVVEDGTSMDYTIIGLQKNGKLEEVEELDLIATVSGHLTPEEMLGYAESSNTTALITAAVIALAFAIPGVIMLVKAGKKHA
jgi:phosphoribosylcarboxyaminoimidazole (NCAIR) mutase